MSRRQLGVILVLLLLVGLAFVALPAEAHTDAELVEWEADWEERAQVSLSRSLLAEYRDMVERHPCRVVDCPEPELAPAAVHAPIPAPNVEMWRGLVEAHFGPNADAALRVMACESLGNPDAVHPRSRASGLFQFLPSTWSRTMGESYPGGVFDGNRNIEAAAKLSKGGTDWSQWSCKP